MYNYRRFESWVQAINKKYNTEFEFTDLEKGKEGKAKIPFKKAFTMVYSHLLLNGYLTDKLDFYNYRTWYGGVNFEKIDSFLFNKYKEEIGVEIYNWSCSEKLKLLLGKIEFKNVCKAF